MRLNRRHGSSTHSQRTAPATAPATATLTESLVVATLTDDESIRPFRFEASDAALEDLRRRILATRWPDRETVSDDSQGVQLATMQQLADYWANHYDWRRIEARLNAFPNFLTEIDGLDIHFIHIRSRHENALPIIVTHGWPGSVVEQLKLIEPLTDPTTHGGTEADAFHVVIPSLPGNGSSGKPTTTGWGPERVARAWVTLMQRLGYTRFVAQGGDWGAIITDLRGAHAPPELAGIHSNMPGAVPPHISALLGPQRADTPPADLSAEEARAFAQLTDVFTEGIGYAVEMALRPQALYGLADSPAALSAWMLDHDALSLDDITHAFVDGSPVGGVTRDGGHFVAWQEPELFTQELRAAFRTMRG
jgi:pimeloyl-ACP methyl ester carboxylesterase